MKEHGGHLLRTDHMVQEHTGAPKPLPLFCNQSKRLLFSCAKGGGATSHTFWGKIAPKWSSMYSHKRGVFQLL